MASEISHKKLLPPARSSFSSLEVFNDCSGGNSRPSRLSGVGGGTFFNDGQATKAVWRKKLVLHIRHLSFVINSGIRHPCIVILFQDREESPGQLR